MSGGIRDEDITRVREASDLVSIVNEVAPLKRRGRDFWCCCPFHHEKTPSMKVDQAGQFWHCFGCGAGGDVFSFVMKLDDLTFPEAVRQLADRAHIDIVETGGNHARVSSDRKTRLRDVCEQAAAFYHTQLMRSPQDDAAKARAYLAGRSMGGPVPNRWNLGYAPGRGSLIRHLSSKGFSPDEMVQANVAMKSKDGRLRDRFFGRVMFPINNAQGECIAFGGRVIGSGEPKYLNSQETPIFHKSQVLYGLDKAKASMTATGIAVVVEGYTDVIALHESGITNVVATLGTALTLSHIRLLSRHAGKRIVYLFDGDAAGQRAADRALQFIDESMTPEAGRSRIDVAAVTLPDDLDPAEFVDQRGADALQDLISHAKPLLQYGIERRLSAHDLGTAEGRTRGLTDALSILAPIKDSLLAKDYAIQIAGMVRAREQDVLDQLATLQPPRRYEDPESSAPSPANNPSPQSRSLPQTELNRLRFERELLSLLALHPDLASSHAEALIQTRWHDSRHEQVAKSLMETLEKNPAPSSAEMITNASQVIPHASSVLTAAMVPRDMTPQAMVDYLAEELSIGDAEDTIESLKAMLADAQSMGEEEYNQLFESVIGMQQDLSRRRKSHKPLA